MRKFLKKFRLGDQYLRYLFSYMTVLLIPLVILTFFYSSRFMKKFYDEIFETVDLELVQLGTQIENQWNSMQSIVNQLALTGTINQASSAQTPLNLSPVITYLSGFCSANPFITDIALILDGQDYVSTSQTTCQKDYYFQHILQFPDKSGPAFQDQLLLYNTPVCLPSQKILNLGLNSNVEDMLLFVFPVFTDYQKREGAILFFVKDSSIQDFWSQKLQNYQAQTYILDQHGTVIVDSQVNSNAMADDGQDYIIRSYVSPSNHWSYQAYLPDKQATFSQVSAIIGEFLLAIIIILLISSFTIYVLQKVNYAPVRRLWDKAKRLSPEGSSKNELVDISNALDFLSNQNDTLSTRLAGSLTAVKNQRLYRLFSGNYGSREDFNLDCQELDLSLPNPYFAVIILMFHQQTGDLDVLSQEIKAFFKDSCTYYYLHNFHSNQIVLLTNITSPSVSLERAFEKLQGFLQKKYNYTTTVGIGCITDSTEHIAQSYMEASSALDYRFVKGNGTVIRFQEAGTFQTPILYPHQDFEALKNSLLIHNEQAIHSSIQNIICFMEQNQMPLYLARNICFDLIHMVNEHCQVQKDSSSVSPIRLSGMETAQEIIQMLRQWSEKSHDFTARSSKKAAIDDVISYLNANCQRCDFSAYEAALQFHMTLPAFSKFFKDSTGQNVMDYTIYLRIQKAKELLSSTDLPLKDISEQVGYYNVSSFTRRFKLNQGITPSEYRKASSKRL